MDQQKYNVGQFPVSSILSWIKDGEIAIPEIQRPFVWNKTKVRKLMDSLYQGYPVGYIISWKNPDVRLKDGTRANGKKVLIDGQQRICAMRAAILGEPVINDEYASEHIHIAFQPMDQRFETLTPAIEKDSKWIPNISAVLNKEGGLFKIVEDYCIKNPDVERSRVEKSIELLLGIKNRQIGYIELDANLEIETVTEIFVRINSEGVVLSQADFAMSKIASFGDFGINLRKCVDYFCHLSRKPEAYMSIFSNDKEFAATEYLSKISWLKDENDDLYDPDYSDMLRVAFTKQFERGKMSELVSLLSGRNFETRTFDDSVRTRSFEQLREGVLDFVNETHFKRFVMIIKSAGFISPDLISSHAALNFAYALYLKLREKKFPAESIERLVRRWFVMSLLTSRYSGSAETIFDYDIKSISRDGAETALSLIEDSELSSAFWESGLIQGLDRSTINSPYLNVFFAAQVKAGDPGFLSKDISVANMIEHRGDIHHLFPKDYLKKRFSSKGDYNQIANYVYAQSEINIKVGNKPPRDYMQEMKRQCEGGTVVYGNITSMADLKQNLQQHCIPIELFDMDIDNYSDFLEERRRLMAQKIKEYYLSL